MRAAPRPVQVRSIEERENVLTAIERRAWQAAWRIVDINPEVYAGYACPGRRRTALMERIAEIVREEISR